MTEYRKWIAPRLTSFTERMGACFIALIPGFVANLVFLLYTFGPIQNSRMARIDLMKSRYYFGNWFNASP